MITNMFTLVDTNGVAQYVGQSVSANVWPSVLLGMGFGFCVYGFGVILRMAKKTTNEF
jgi:hypothetical protein